MKNDDNTTTVVSVLLVCGLPGSGKTTNVKRIITGCSCSCVKGRSVNMIDKDGDNYRQHDGEVVSACTGTTNQSPYHNNDDDDDDETDAHDETNEIHSKSLSFDKVYYINYDDITQYLQEKDYSNLDDDNQREEVLNTLVERSLVIHRERFGCSKKCTKSRFHSNGTTDINGNNNHEHEDNYNTEKDELFVFNELHLNAWKSTRRVALQILERILLRKDFSESTSNILIIMDDNFYLKSMRYNVIQTCRKKHHCDETISINVSIIYFNTPLQECHRRNNLRQGQHKIPRSIIDRMSKRFEIPSPSTTIVVQEDDDGIIGPTTTSIIMKSDDDNNDVIVSQCQKQTSQQHPMAQQQLQQQIPYHVIHIQPTTNIQLMLEQINALLQISRTNPLCSLGEDDTEERMKKKQKDREITLTNRIHQIDQLLRKLVAVTCQYNKQHAKIANKTRKSLLEYYREHEKENAHNDTSLFDDDDDDDDIFFSKEIILIDKYMKCLKDKLQSNDWDEILDSSTSCSNGATSKSKSLTTTMKTQKEENNKPNMLRELQKYLEQELLKNQPHV